MWMGEIVLLQKEPIPKHDRAVDASRRLRAVPADEFVDCVTVGFLRTRGWQRVQHRGFRMFLIGEPKYRLGPGPFQCFLATCHTGGLLSRGAVWRNC